MVVNGFREEWFVAPADCRYESFQIVKIEPQKGSGKFLRTGKVFDAIPLDKVRSIPFDGVVPGVYVVKPRRRFVSGVNRGRSWYGRPMVWVGVDEFGNVFWFEYVCGEKGSGLPVPPKELVKFFDFSLYKEKKS